MIIAALLLAGIQRVAPIAPVPRFGAGSPVYTEPGRYYVAPGYGPGPASRAIIDAPRRGYLTRREVEAACSGPAYAGFTKVYCTDPLAARVGAMTRCNGEKGPTIFGMRVTVSRYNPATRDIRLNCRITSTLPSGHY